MQGVGEESAGMGLVERGEGLLEPLAPAAVEVDRRAHAGRVHLLEVVLHPLGREGRLAAAEVVVHVDDREGRPGDLGRLGHQHGPGLPVAELQLPDVALLLGERGAGGRQRGGDGDGEQPVGGSAHGGPSDRSSRPGPDPSLGPGSPSASAKPAGPSSLREPVGPAGDGPMRLVDRLPRGD